MKFINESLLDKAKEEFVVANENNLTVVLDITLDRDLMLEGLARELIRSIQVMRKSANFNVEDRIDIELITASADLNEIIKKFADKIKAELLARSITTIENPEYCNCRKGQNAVNYQKNMMLCKFS